MKHIKKAECELMVGVTFHGGDEELIEDVTFHGGDEELIEDVTFHGGDEELIEDVTFHGGDEELIEDVTFHDKGKDPRVVSAEATKPNVSPMNGTPRPANAKTMPKNGK